MARFVQLQQWVLLKSKQKWLRANHNRDQRAPLVAMNFLYAVLASRQLRLASEKLYLWPK